MPDPTQSVPLGDLVEINPKDFPAGGAVPYVGMEDVSEGGQLLHIRYRSSDSISPGQPTFRDGDVLFAKITPCMENGKGAFVSGLGDAVAQGSTEFHVLRARRGVDQRFIYQWTRTSVLRRAAEALMTGSAGQRRVPAEFFMKFRVPAFSGQEQRRIAEILDALDERVAAQERLIAKQVVLQGGIAESLLTSVAVGRERLSDYLASPPKNGYSPKDVEEWTGVLALGLGCLTAGGFQPRQLKNVPGGDPRNNAALLKDGDLLMSRANTRELVGLVGIYRDIGYPCIYPDLMMRLTPLASKCRTEYLELVLRSPEVRRQIQGMAQGTSESMVKISSSIVQDLNVRIPSLEVQDRTIRILRASKERLAAEEDVRDRLLKLKEGLAEDLLTGRVRVPEAEEMVAGL